MLDISSDETALNGYSYFISIFIGSLIGYFLNPVRIFTSDLTYVDILFRGMTLKDSFYVHYAEIASYYVYAGALIGFFVMFVVDNIKSKKS
ncbi:hypothetical protein SAMN04488589_0497 [Methanolobus vulcani]|uniref:Uncharacterized protein n=1 Tax=Methanolobus vulcani TaxID=38026 RepID=A0A7Z7AUR7_9EURY|nr:hypothetical protein [Methanolobus vulcani]SDF43127.1 hypothetical protein SAMN04488589_0497 [Methanolobus vulcani]